MSRRSKPQPSAGRKKELNASVLRSAMLRILPYRMRGQGEIAFPAVPALLEHYLENCRTLFACFGRTVSDAEIAGLGRLLLPALEEGFRASSRSEVMVRFETLTPPGNSLRYTVKLVPQSTADLYQIWADTRTTPLFGAQPDAKVLDVARSLGAPSTIRVLDVGAGSGRNALALSRLGFRVDALEPAPALVGALRNHAQGEDLALRVLEGNFEDPALALGAEPYQLVFLAGVVSTHVRDVAALREVVTRASGLLSTGGALLFDMFVCVDGYKPELLARQMSSVCWCPLFTPGELEAVVRELPLERVSQESVLDYERRLSADGTSERAEWFEGWASGLDLFDLPMGRAPVEQRWFVFRKRG